MPLERVAVVGGVVEPEPPEVMVRGVPGLIVFAADSTTIAVAPVNPLKLLTLQVCPSDPVTEPPDK